MVQHFEFFARLGHRRWVYQVRCRVLSSVKSCLPYSGLIKVRYLRNTGRSKKPPLNTVDDSTGAEPSRNLKERFAESSKPELRLNINTEAPYPSPKVPSDVERFRAQDQTKYSYRPSSIPASQTSIIVFPGQGTQYVGMGKTLINFDNVKELFATANNILGYDLLNLCLNGPKAQLNKTVFCQPAVFVCSLAAVEKLRFQNPSAVENCISTAGFSVGEYAALVFAGSLSFEDALKIVKIRAEAMQSCSELEPSGLMTVHLKPSSRLDLAMEGALEWVRSQGQIKDPVCQIANFLFTRCKVIGGHEEALKFVEKNASKFDIRCKRVDVSGAFHTRLMKPAGDELKEKILKFTFKESPRKIDVRSNIDGKVYTKPYEIAKRLVKQVYTAVDWESTMKYIYEDNFKIIDENNVVAATTYECGPGKQLGAMLKQTNAKAYERYKNIFDDE